MMIRALVFVTGLVVATAALTPISTAEEECTLAKCAGATPCKACRDCSKCKYCHKDGGYCGICSKPAIVD